MEETSGKGWVKKSRTCFEDELRASELRQGAGYKLLLGLGFKSGLRVEVRLSRALKYCTSRILYYYE